MVARCLFGAFLVCFLACRLCGFGRCLPLLHRCPPAPSPLDPCPHAARPLPSCHRTRGPRLAPRTETPNAPTRGETVAKLSQGSFSAPKIGDHRNCRRLFAPMDFFRSGENVGKSAVKSIFSSKDYHYTDNICAI